ncbi:MAG: hypothetical protein ACSHXK_05320 [Oceanococcus sp.]
MKSKQIAALCAASVLASPAFSHGDEHATEHVVASPVRADSHAPIGVMGDHLHKKGEWMLSYRYMRMQMEDNYNGTDKQSNDSIATSEPNRFANPPMMPPTLRVVPTDMSMDMHMLGGMYAPSDAVTMMLMLPYIEKSMDHITYQGGMGTNQLGGFTTETSGFGDAKLSALIRLCGCAGELTHATIGASFPTGSIDERDEILTPMNMRPSPVLPYPMQLGSGTYDLLTGLTHNRRIEAWSLGAQYAGTWRLGRNSEEYSLGDIHALSVWTSYQFQPVLSVSLRLKGQYQGKIDGMDARIMAPVQSADPDRQGGKRIDAGLGLNLAGQDGLRGHRLALEFLLPLYQDLNGPQLGTSSQIIVGYQYAR